MTRDPAAALPAPPAALVRALRLADLADAESMSALQAEITAYARALREAHTPQSRITYGIRALVDDSLPTRVVPIRTSENRTRLLQLAAEWSADPAS